MLDIKKGNNLCLILYIELIQIRELDAFKMKNKKVDLKKKKELRKFSFGFNLVFYKK